MPRRNLARRFDPWRGVSRNTLEVEAGYVRREIENLQAMSLQELADRVVCLRQHGQQSSQSLRSLLDELPERAKLHMEAIIFRDFYHMMELYRTCIGCEPQIEEDEAPPRVAELSTQQPAELPFREWLFDSDE